jgi:hypothetical protein
MTVNIIQIRDRVNKDMNDTLEKEWIQRNIQI